MMSQTHLLMAGALLTKPADTCNGRLRNAAVILGAFLPDAAIYVLFAWSKIAGIPERRVWDEIYFSGTWQDWVAAGNSGPIWLVVLILGAIALRSGGLHRAGILLFFTAAAALIHIVGDAPVHVDDAHRHLWPLSDLRFVSPVSYWDPDHHGRIFMVFEAALGLLLSVILFRRFHALWVRFLLVTVMIAYLGVPTYFWLALG
ncbi:MAG: hypothetical protein AAF764_03560 [Pseudomonadota bacterium]